jgi:KDO2-lipid IV(A) lauroyltransferase
MKKVLAKIFRGLIVVLSQLPLKFHYFMGDVFAWIAKNIFKYRLGMVWMNVSRAFPEKKHHQLRQIVNDYYTHLGEIVAETIWFGGSDYKRLNRQGIVTVKNPEVINEIYLSSPSTTVLFTHCGNWEILGGLPGYMRAGGKECPFTENDITVVYKKMSSEVSDMVFAENRVAPLPGKFPECEVESMNILRFALQHRNEKRVYIYPTDQSPYHSTGKHPMGIFMNQQTNAMLGSAVVASKLSHAVVYMKMKRVERGRYEMSLIPICANASEHKPEDIMRKYYDLLEQEINETPANWLWSHKRWK